MALFDCAVDYNKDVFRNIRGIQVSQDLFDDLSDDPSDWEAANRIDIHTHPLLTNTAVIQRAFDYSKNNFIDYPFEHITASRYNDGSIGCWYGSETLETSIYETCYHFIQEIQDAYELFNEHPIITVDRRVALVHCQGLAFDLSHKATEYPWLIDPLDYSQCRNIGQRIANEGHPLLIVPSARHNKGVNVAAFRPDILSNARDYCYLQYVYDLPNQKISAYRGNLELCFEVSVREDSELTIDA